MRGPATGPRKPATVPSAPGRLRGAGEGSRCWPVRPGRYAGTPDPSSMPAAASQRTGARTRQSPVSPWGRRTGTASWLPWMRRGRPQRPGCSPAGSSGEHESCSPRPPPGLKSHPDARLPRFQGRHGSGACRWGPAELILSNDEDLLVLHPWRGVRIIRPRPFLAQVDRTRVLQEAFAGVVVEQPGVPDIAREHLHGFVTADLLDLPDVGPCAGGSGDKACAEAVPGIARRVQPGGQGAGLHDAGDGVV